MLFEVDSLLAFPTRHGAQQGGDNPVRIEKDNKLGQILKAYYKEPMCFRFDFDCIECFTTTFLCAHSWLNWVDDVFQEIISQFDISDIYLSV